MQHAIQKAKAARGMWLILGYLGGLLGGAATGAALQSAGREDLFDTVMGISMVVGLVAGWAYGRWKYRFVDSSAAPVSPPR